jgi:AraC family transcriptional regulator of arabinose operon
MPRRILARAVPTLDGSIPSYVRSFARLHSSDSRLWKLWEAVGKALEHPWTVDELAANAFVCREHLRRLCQSERLGDPKEGLAV